MGDIRPSPDPLNTASHEHHFIFQPHILLYGQLVSVFGDIQIIRREDEGRPLFRWPSPVRLLGLHATVHATVAK